ncbi:MAG: tRNA (N(6)-L-threonylcarbamoyladenosine(37)-C(2))-methylthiotransferase MtaB [Salinivirgaceae bacterium]
MITKKVALTTLGCKLNFSESSGIAQQFEEAGYTRVEPGEQADVYIINTCTVTELANKKSKQAIRKMIKQNPKAKVVAVGCYSQLKPNEVSAIEGVDLVLGSDNKFEVLKELEKLEAGSPTQIVVSKSHKEDKFTPSYSFGDRTRSFLKVQDGCDYFCSYCTIPGARGRSRNNSVEETIAKAREVISKGIKEIILTGVNIGDFGRSTDENFFQLVKAFERVEGLERLRISSIEPNLLTDEILEFAVHSTKIVPHFHLPLQCGTDHLLRLMRRRYTTSLYARRIAKIKSLLPDACIAADVIVGVPGETDDEFEKSLEFIRSIDISYLHVFTYSERENTMAVKMEGQVPPEIRKERSRRMHELALEKQTHFQQQHLNTVRPVLFEAMESKGLMSGFTDNYIKVEIPFQKNLINTTQPVKLERIKANGTVQGKLIIEA